MLCVKNKQCEVNKENPRGGTKKFGLRALKLGHAENEDIRFLLNGSKLRKIRSRRWQKERIYRLQDDGMSFWFETKRKSKKAPSMHTFSVNDIEVVWEGHQSEGLLKYGGIYPEKQCFTVVFKGQMKNLDLVAPTEEEAKRWIRGINILMEKAEAMSQLEKLDHWIHDYLHRADTNKDNKMSFKEIRDLLKMINIEMDDKYAYNLFKKCDKSNTNKLEDHEIVEFCTLLMRRPEVEEIFKHYSGEDLVLSDEELLHFLKEQGEADTLENARRIIQKYELNEKAKQHNFMMLDGFMMYLLSREGDIFNQDHDQVYQDMTRPLSHYFISSSHNTYLTENQFGGPSSTEAYYRALMKGCRCVELDCWNGVDGEPIIYHGHALTSKILFRDVIKTIKDCAFQVSPYPVILSLENHCSVDQQSVMTQHLKNILQDALLTQTIDGKIPKELPSPEQLKGKILVKGKKLQNMQSKSDISSSSSEDEEEGYENQKKTQWNSKLISKDFSDVIVYCKSVHFHGFEHAQNKQAVYEMSSFAERKARKLMRESGSSFVRHNCRQLSRIYPSGLRTHSSNYNPQEMWNVGCQIVALNFQTPGYEMDLNQGKFRQNKNCGYILKPAFMRNPDAAFDPECIGQGGNHQMRTLIVEVITAQQLPKVNKDKKNSIVDPLVRVEVHGVPKDTCKKQTEYILNNGFNPSWKQSPTRIVTFNIQVPELALIRFVVEDYDTTSSNDFVGQFTLPFTSLKKGYRHIHLLSKDGASLSPATLFVHIKISQS
ncbi:1-phosphatidylinositol 4,5-bisphosphate phosphodiesterase delta-3 isoform X1 [Latimeria chalumnae]|nr:PREDICTED: 1-phosphatidylinositol 4,5-bisphosphate phosphodiesterase delta-3 isoform X1 [Latimeria chalumnae]|eukprot:XP_014353948.1 PREDICTED: 1-phosphatidylinositol 4,5-bisphosphate phosphodiesterase delta-3 isoform X1 [Latimeria chalumnae]